MHGNRDDVVSGYVRQKIRDWRESGRELQDLARVAGFAKSTPSQVLQGTGVGQKTGPKFAHAFGFASYDAMKVAAFDWWKMQMASALAQDPPPAMIEAVDLVVSLGQGTTAQVGTILAAYAHPRFRERDKDWWVATLLEELKQDRLTLRSDKTERKEAAAGQRAVRASHKKPAAAHSPSKRRRAS